MEPLSQPDGLLSWPRLLNSSKAWPELSSFRYINFFILNGVVSPAPEEISGSFFLLKNLFPRWTRHHQSHKKLGNCLWSEDNFKQAFIKYLTVYTISFTITAELGKILEFTKGVFFLSLGFQIHLQIDFVIF